MKLYLEAREVPPEDAPPDYVPELIQVEVKDNELSAMRELRSKLDPNKRYVVYRHYCYHDEGRPCRLERIWP